MANHSLKSSAKNYTISRDSLFIVYLAVIIFGSCVVRIHGLDLGLRTHEGLSFFKKCSRTCESMFCEAPPFLRYGKYCGLLYTGCRREKPCDPLDACCMHHDHCISRMGNDYLSERCNQEFLKCVAMFERSNATSFTGNTCNVDQVVKSMNKVIEAAVVAGKLLGKP